MPHDAQTIRGPSLAELRKQVEALTNERDETQSHWTGS
jgi:hypothetical protein